jgi:hypothetical protein
LNFEGDRCPNQSALAHALHQRRNQRTWAASLQGQLALTPFKADDKKALKLFKRDSPRIHSVRIPPSKVRNQAPAPVRAALAATAATLLHRKLASLRSAKRQFAAHPRTVAHNPSAPTATATAQPSPNFN